MMQSKNAGVYSWLAEPLAKDVAQAINLVAALDSVERVAIMPDVHLAKEVCVGMVVAARDKIYPAAVGSDIGCGMAAVRCQATADLLANEHSAAKLLAGLYQKIPSLKHRGTAIPASLSDLLLQSPLSDPRLEKLKSREGRLQLGTLGRGNHFLEFQRDDDRLWLMVHSGSRGMGQAISTHHTSLAMRETSAKRLPGLDANSSAARSYLSDAA